MAEDLLRVYPELRPFVLSNVHFTGTRIGSGAYGRVDEVAVPVGAAAKTIYAFLQDIDGSEPDDEVPKAVTEFVRECLLMSTLRHPHIVQFLGVCFLQGSRLPALVMERLLTSLHDLIAPEIRPPPGAPSPLSFFLMGLKCSVLHNVASGLAYLHERSPPVIHRDLSARNVLLNSGLVGKIADLGMARIVPRMRAAATMTKGPGASVYMPPEAVAPSASNREKSTYDASIDVFSLGVVALFTIGETFPCDPLAPTYTDEYSGLLVARTELERRSRYMANVNAQLRACGQLRGDHPLITLIQQCLHNGPHKRPNIREVLSLLEEARAGFRDEESEMNKRNLVQALQNQPRNQNLEHFLQDLVTENADLQSHMQQQLQFSDNWEVVELQQQLHSSEREKQTLRQQLNRDEKKLASAEETIRRKQQQIQEMEAERAELVHRQEDELAQLQEQLKQQVIEEDVVEGTEEKYQSDVHLHGLHEELHQRQLPEDSVLQSNLDTHRLQPGEQPAFQSDVHRQTLSSDQLQPIEECEWPNEETLSSELLNTEPSPANAKTPPNRSVSEPAQLSTCQAHQQIEKEFATHQINMADIEYGRVLGGGGSGTVYHGFWKSKGIQVALKTVKISPEKCDARIMAELGEHPNIISFFGFAHKYPETIIVTALATNGSLGDYLHKQHQVPLVDQSLKWAKQIAYGMAHMHKLHIVHRDLKSSNILFTNDMEVQLCDFGISRPMPNTTNVSKESGTWRWMAPEVAKKTQVNKACDVFSFSMVVWELMEHRIPFFDEDSEILASMQIISGKRPPFLSVWPKYLQDLIQCCWYENPHNRPPFTDIVTSLENKINFRR